jgi:two-component system, chemotaxis family, sensor kinase CheA
VDDLTGEFIAETRETLEAIGEALVAWEADPSDSARLDEIFRFVHTVKGSCGFLDLTRIEALAHAAETVLSELRDNRRVADQRLVGVMLNIIDRIARLVDALDHDTSFPPIAGDELLIAAIHAPNSSDFIRVDEPEATRSVVRTVRVSVDLLDTMMNQVSDLVLVRNELARSVKTTRGDSHADASLERLSACVADLRDGVARARMQPVERLFSALPRLVRDTAAAVGKSVRLLIEGSDVELDREMVEQLRDPLVHMVRNAIDHGIEARELRTAIGKPECATLRIEARQNGNQIAISVADDGRGIDCVRLRSRAVDSGLIDARGAAALSDDAAAELIFLPGLTTADSVSAISGRGVGMDVVRSNIEKLGGAIALQNDPGRGLKVELRAPLTLSIVSVLSIKANGQFFAIPRTAVDEVFSLNNPAVEIEELGDGRIARIRGETLSVMAMAKLTGAESCQAEYLLVIDSGNGHRWALAADGIGDHQEVVIRPVAPVVAALGLYAGQALPDDGKPLLILDVLGLAKLARLECAEVRQQTAQGSVIEEQISLVTFKNLSGRQAAVSVSVVERISEMPRTAFTTIGDAVIVNDDGLIYAASFDGDFPEVPSVTMLRISNGSDRIGLIVTEAQDLACVPRKSVTKTRAGDVVIVNGLTIPVLDVAALFQSPDQAAAPAALPQPKVCRA